MNPDIFPLSHFLLVLSMGVGSVGMGGGGKDLFFNHVDLDALKLFLQIKASFLPTPCRLLIVQEFITIYRHFQEFLHSGMLEKLESLK